MRKFILEFIARITSRKFILTLTGAITLAINQQWAEFVTLISVYLTAEGAGDVVERLKGGVSTPNGYINPESQNDAIEIDTSVIETGKSEDTPMFNEQLKEES